MGRQKDYGSKIAVLVSDDQQQQQMVTTATPTPTTTTTKSETNGENNVITAAVASKNSTIVDMDDCQIDLDHKQQQQQSNNIVQSIIDHKSEMNVAAAAICRICHCSNDDLTDTTTVTVSKSNTMNFNETQMIRNNQSIIFIQPCYCTGTLQYVHHDCLQQWIRSSNHKYCELCKYHFQIKTKNKPIFEWQCFNMTPNERRKLILHITFNLISMICVFWSVYVIAERASYELMNRFGWQFWIKLALVAIGLICGIIFIIFQLRLYISLLLRWKQFNQIFIIENVCK